MRTREEVTVPDLDIDAIVDAIEAVPVTAAVLYGSYARGEATDASDVDIAVVFDDALDSGERTRARLALIERLSTGLGTDAVDVVSLSQVSTEMRRDIFTDGICLYGSLDEAVEEDTGDKATDDPLADFDELLAQLERVV